MLLIRPEQATDATAVRYLNELAFGRAEEADLVDMLRSRCLDAPSLVALDGEVVVGHILFTPVVVEHGNDRVTGMGLAPMAVLPSHQGQGVGSALVRRGLELLHDRRCPFVVVVGHPSYYPRFGFEPASRRGLTSQRPGMPDDAFMAIVLDERAMAGVAGVARYRGEFDSVT